MKITKLYAALLLTPMIVACGDDDAAAPNGAAAAAAACNPVGTWNLARSTFTGEGGTFCTNNATINNGSAAVQIYVIAKNADGTFSYHRQNDDDSTTKYNLDTAKCVMVATPEPTSTQVTDAKGGFGTTNESRVVTVTFTNKATQLSDETVRMFSAAQNVSGTGNVDGVPCTLKSVTTGTKM